MVFSPLRCYYYPICHYRNSRASAINPLQHLIRQGVVMLVFLSFFYYRFGISYYFGGVSTLILIIQRLKGAYMIVRLSNAGFSICGHRSSRKLSWSTVWSSASTVVFFLMLSNDKCPSSTRRLNIQRVAEFILQIIKMTSG